MDRKEEILKEATKRTINIISGSPLHNAVTEAMETYKRECVIEEIRKLQWEWQGDNEQETYEQKDMRLRKYLRERISELKK